MAKPGQLEDEPSRAYPGFCLAGDGFKFPGRTSKLCCENERAWSLHEQEPYPWCFVRAIVRLDLMLENTGLAMKPVVKIRARIVGVLTKSRPCGTPRSMPYAVNL